MRGQIVSLKKTGLFDAASYMLAGVNGGQESLSIANLAIPKQACTLLHGLQCRNECRTIRALETWLPGHEDYYVLYFHAKGITHQSDMRKRWRDCMTINVIDRWRRCVSDLDSGYESVGCHWMTGDATPPGHSIWAGNFWWAKASFLMTLPSIMERDRIHVSGIDSVDSRYESEVWIGNGKRLPKVLDYHPHWNPGKIGTCETYDT